MDRHFCDAALERNGPAMLALAHVFNRSGLDRRVRAVVPYARRLALLPAFLQQLETESNGKGVDRDGRPLKRAAAAAVFGDAGTSGQHAFFQMLHQGSGIHAVDFILPLRAAHSLDQQQRMLIANCLAQSAALMQGKPVATAREELQVKGLQGEALEQAIPPRVFGGNRPSNTLLLPQLDAWHLGALLALYEHRTFVMSVLWNINAFDQWGVELGKQLAQSVLKAMEQRTATGLDASTAALLAHTRN
jgi:glucose-6-phosphate isomerase